MMILARSCSAAVGLLRPVSIRRGGHEPGWRGCTPRQARIVARNVIVACTLVPLLASATTTARAAEADSPVDTTAIVRASITTAELEDAVRIVTQLSDDDARRCHATIQALLTRILDQTSYSVPHYHTALVIDRLIGNQMPVDDQLAQRLATNLPTSDAGVILALRSPTLNADELRALAASAALSGPGWLALVNHLTLLDDPATFRDLASVVDPQIVLNMIRVYCQTNTMNTPVLITGHLHHDLQGLRFHQLVTGDPQPTWTLLVDGPTPVYHRTNRLHQAHDESFNRRFHAAQLLHHYAELDTDVTHLVGRQVLASNLGPRSDIMPNVEANVTASLNAWADLFAAGTARGWWSAEQWPAVNPRIVYAGPFASWADDE